VEFPEFLAPRRSWSPPSLVLGMSPGLALFKAGLIRLKSTVTFVAQIFTSVEEEEGSSGWWLHRVGAIGAAGAGVTQKGGGLHDVIE
jgi:hypothetical protein